ncbi:MAG TPA: prolyl oligopeptidase family serine peptidase [Acidimicrobiales bacterium]|nr:prolyl oligopeptidase family serine peptidase [Acidimicrobiales bacterium]
MSREPNQGRNPPPRPRTLAGFGWWPSPFTPARVAAGKASRSGLQADGSAFFWLESRPAEGGRQVMVADRTGDAPVDVSPPTVSLRSRVHEYGGGAATVTGGVLYYVDQADQRLYRSTPGDDRPPLPLTAASPPGSSFRYADGVVTRSGAWMVTVEEDHDGRDTRHRLAAVATDGSQPVVPLVDAGGLVAAPRPSPDGRRLAWVEWRHPDMSWDQSELWVANLVESAAGIGIAEAHRLLGGEGVAVGQPMWCRDGSLVTVADPSGWWLPHRIAVDRLDDPDAAVRLVDLDAEFHAPDWALGQATMAELPDGSIIGRMHRGGRDHLVRLQPPVVTDQAGAANPPRWDLTEIDQPCVTISGVAASADGRRIGVLGATATAGMGVYQVRADGSGPVTRLTPVAEAGDLSETDGDIARAEPFEAPSPAGPIPGFYYPPTNAQTQGPTGARPPLVVFCHGGPTGAAEPGFDPLVQFFTSRGLAVAAVNYRGSSGYGRSYRRSLEGLWGVADIDDCTAYAEALAAAGRVDGARLAIRGTSAGGLTALGALVRTDRFSGAASWYGVTDLRALATDTHDFESRYMDGLVGPLPAAADLYRQRSPLFHPEEVTGAVLLLQGADDPVVPPAQSERFAEALSAHGVRCRLEVFAGESHGFRRAETIEACLTAELEFYRSLFDPAPASDPPEGDPGPPGIG